MTAEIESLVLEHLRAIRADLSDVKERLTRVESRITSLEITTAGMRRDLAHMYGDGVSSGQTMTGWRPGLNG